MHIVYIYTKTADNLVFRIPNPVKLIVLQILRFGRGLTGLVSPSNSVHPLLIGNKKDALSESKDML